MTTPRSTETTETSLTHDLIYAARYYLGRRRGLLVLAGLVIVAGMGLNWSWLVAAGIAPILISAVPCLAMCAFGLCMNKGGGKSCSTAVNTQDSTAVGHDAASIAQAAALAAPPEPVAAESPAGATATTPTISKPPPSKERNPSDA